MPATARAEVRGARTRIEDAAVELFRERGLRGVSADRIIERASVSKVTFYRHFPAKDDVILAYLRREWDDARAAVSDHHADITSDDALDRLMSMFRAQICTPGFRGCPFINAAAELTEPDHPALALIRDYRAWLADRFEEGLVAAGVPDADTRARDILMLRDGAMVAGYLSADTDAVVSDFDASLRRLIGLSN
jgi:AcrR family transcriptional regulator